MILIILICTIIYLILSTIQYIKHKKFNYDYIVYYLISTMFLSMIGAIYINSYLTDKLSRNYKYRVTVLNNEYIDNEYCDSCHFSTKENMLLLYRDDTLYKALYSSPINYSISIDYSNTQYNIVTHYPTFNEIFWLKIDKNGK